MSRLVSWFGHLIAFFQMMYLLVLAILAVFTLHAADDRQLALTVKAQSDFDRVELAAVPQVQDAAACVQAEASLLSLAPREEAPLIHYRKAYCGLVGATLTHGASEFAAAAAEFDRAIETWSDRFQNGEQVSSGLRALDWIAKLEAAGAHAAECGSGSTNAPQCAVLERAQNELAIAVETRACPASIMPAAFCESVLQTARLWLGWMALQRDNLYVAAEYLSSGTPSGWQYWEQGEQAFREDKYADAAARYKQAVDAWKQAALEPAPSLADRLGPQPNIGKARTELGGAQLLAGDPTTAIATLDSAVKADPAYARAYYLRGRAKQMTGQIDAALADYGLAARTAFAEAKDLASGEAHLYRGVAAFARKDYAHAEDEFSSALNFDIPAKLKPDAEAWRYLAAVAGGSCGSSRDRLERALETSSPYFPKGQARSLIFACAPQTTSAAPTSGGAVR